MDFREFWIQQAIMAGIGYILMTLKNPESDRAKLLKSSLIHLADAIYVAFHPSYEASPGMPGIPPPQPLPPQPAPPPQPSPAPEPIPTPPPGTLPPQPAP